MNLLLRESPELFPAPLQQLEWMSFGLEHPVQIGVLGLRGHKLGVLLGGHAEIAVHISALAKLDVQFAWQGLAARRIEKCGKRFWTGSAKLLSDLVDLVGIEPTTSSMPWNSTIRKLLTAKAVKNRISRKNRPNRRTLTPI